MKTNNEYQQKAIDFLKSTKTTIEITFSKHDYHFACDKEKRDIYNIVIRRGNRSISFNFGNSLNDSGFYVMIGRTKHDLPLNLINSKNLSSYIRTNICYSYMYNIDTIHKPVPPREYDILACLTKYDVGTFENFCSDFGYDTDSKTAEKTYNAVKKEYTDICTIWTDSEIEQLQEIQ